MKSAMHVGVIVVVLVWAGSVPADTHYVAAGQSIQAAIDAADSGDEVAVAPGTYLEAIDFKGKAIRLYGTAGAESTTIDGTGNFHVVQCASGEGPGTILEGFTITGGYAYDFSTDPPGSHFAGGGLYCPQSTPTVTRCTFQRNTGRYGAGIHGPATVSYCKFIENWSYDGGGIYGAGIVSHSTFLNNDGSTGGAISGGESASDCTFTDNGSLAVVVRSMTNCTLIHDIATASTAVNCRFIDSSLAGLYCGVFEGPYEVTNCTFVGCPDAIRCTTADLPIAVTNCIIWGWTGAPIYQGIPVVTYSDVQGGWPGEGNIDSDPLFADPDGRLSAGSPCIDAGTNSPAGGLPATDIEGNARPLDGNGDGQAVADMGAYEHPVVPVPSQDPLQLCANLINCVKGLDLHKGIENALHVKLAKAHKVLEQRSAKNDTTAVGSLRAFINSVHAQRGKKIPQPAADTLIAAAQQIIDLLAGT